MQALGGLSGLSGLVPQAFTPATLVGLVLWLKADAGTFQDTGLATPAAADGDLVGGWKDFSGRGNHATQGTGAAKGTLKLSAQNGLPSILFDGTDDFLAVNGVASVFAGVNSPYSVVAAYKTLGASANIFQAGRVADATPIIEDYGNTITTYRRDVGGALVTGVYSQSTPAGFLTTSRVFSGPGYLAYQNGVQVLNTSLSVGNLVLDEVSVGAVPYGATPETDFFSGSIAELLLYNRAISNSERQAVEAYLKTKWGTP